MNTKKHESRAAGDLDPSFGNEGTVTLNFESATFELVWDLAVTQDRRILVLGQTAGFKFIVVRLMEDGTWDTFFGIRGSVQLQFQGYASFGESISVLDDGKILVVGVCEKDRQLLPAASRLHANGDLDTAFGEGGYFVLPSLTTPAEKMNISDPISKHQASSSSSSLRSAVLPDGKILITQPTSTNTYGLVIRLTANGVLDESFNGSGYAPVQFPSEDATHTFANLGMGTSKNEILVGGQVDLGPKGEKAMLARYGVDGRPDSNFGDNGSGFIMLAGTRYLALNGLVAGEEDKFVGIGFMNGLEDVRRVATIFGRMANGAPDPDFNNGEFTVFAYQENTEWVSAAVTPMTHDIVATGWAYNNLGGPEGVIVARYLRTGELDKDFGRGTGWVLLAPGQEPHQILQADGKILICYFRPRASCVVMRLLN